tara:strand:+ start:1271 stop:3235 length:1965 start_codon:yes stop_codon:yes gene_type:complete
MKKINEVAPPGREKQVKALKRKFPNDKAAPYKIAWSQHNKNKLGEALVPLLVTKAAKGHVAKKTMPKSSQDGAIDIKRRAPSVPEETSWRERQLARKAEREKEGLGSGTPQKRSAKTERRLGPRGGIQVFPKVETAEEAKPKSSIQQAMKNALDRDKKAKLKKKAKEGKAVNYELLSQEYVPEAKVDAGKSDAEKASARNKRNTPAGKDSKFDTSVFITRKDGEDLDSARTRIRRKKHAENRGVKKPTAESPRKTAAKKAIQKALPYDAVRVEEVEPEDIIRARIEGPQKGLGTALCPTCGVFGCTIDHDAEEEVVDEAKVDAGKDDEGKEDARNTRKFGHVPYNKHGHSVLRRAMHRSDRKVKKIRGNKEVNVETGKVGKEIGEEITLEEERKARRLNVKTKKTIWKTVEKDAAAEAKRREEKTHEYKEKPKRKRKLKKPSQLTSVKTPVTKATTSKPAPKKPVAKKVTPKKTPVTKATTTKPAPKKTTKKKSPAMKKQVARKKKVINQPQKKSKPSFKDFYAKGKSKHDKAVGKLKSEVGKLVKTAKDTAKQHSGHRKKFMKGLELTKKEKKIAGGVGKAVKKSLQRNSYESEGEEYLEENRIKKVAHMIKNLTRKKKKKKPQMDKTTAKLHKWRTDRVKDEKRKYVNDIFQ